MTRFHQLLFTFEAAAKKWESTPFGNITADVENETAPSRDDDGGGDDNSRSNGYWNAPDSHIQRDSEAVKRRSYWGAKWPQGWKWREEKGDSKHRKGVVCLYRLDTLTYKPRWPYLGIHYATVIV